MYNITIIHIFENPPARTDDHEAVQQTAEEVDISIVGYHDDIPVLV